MKSSVDEIDPIAVTVLLAEDDPFLREALVSSLQDCGFRVVEAESGDRALAVLQIGGIDALVTDISMPGELDGWSLAERALAIHPEIVVVYMSSGPEVAARRIVHSLYLQKPFRPGAVASAIRKCLEREGESPADV